MDNAQEAEEEDSILQEVVVENVKEQLADEIKAAKQLAPQGLQRLGAVLVVLGVIAPYLLKLVHAMGNDLLAWCAVSEVCVFVLAYWIGSKITQRRLVKLLESARVSVKIAERKRDSAVAERVAIQAKGENAERELLMQNAALVKEIAYTLKAFGAPIRIYNDLEREIPQQRQNAVIVYMRAVSLSMKEWILSDIVLESARVIDSAYAPHELIGPRDITPMSVSYIVTGEGNDIAFEITIGDLSFMGTAILVFDAIKGTLRSKQESEAPVPFESRGRCPTTLPIRIKNRQS